MMKKFNNYNKDLTGWARYRMEKKTQDRMRNPQVSAFTLSENSEGRQRHPERAYGQPPQSDHVNAAECNRQSHYWVSAHVRRRPAKHRQHIEVVL